jgi:hypothetical protein
VVLIINPVHQGHSNFHDDNDCGEDDNELERKTILNSIHSESVIDSKLKEKYVNYHIHIRGKVNENSGWYFES